MTEDQVYMAAKLWRTGITIMEIAARVGVTRPTLKHVICRNRGRFPHKREYQGRITASAPRSIGSSSRPDRVRWITESGASVTLPRVSFISCPRSA